MPDSLLIGVDVSTTAVKAIAWSAQGKAVAETRAALDTQRPGATRFEQDAHHWWEGLCDCLRGLVARLEGAEIGALALAHQRETFVPVDPNGEPLGPALLWLDGRAEPWIERLRPSVGDDGLRSVTGKTPNYGLSLYKIAWLRDEEPARFARAARFLDIQSFLAERLVGVARTSHSAADPTGLFDIRRHRWDESLCRAVGVTVEQLPEVVAPGHPLGELTVDAARATGLPAGTPLIAAGGDGQTAGLGVGSVTPERGYINLGTAVVAGLFSDHAVAHSAWRTLCGGGGTGYYLESSLRSGALLSDWYLKTLCGIDPATEGEALEALEREAAARPPGSGGLLLLPYWEAVMNPHWDERARGVILGLASDHDRASVYRALIEGVSLEQALFLDAARQYVHLPVSELLAMGGLAASGLWCQTLSDVTGVPIARSASVEAASLGAAMCAAAGIGLYESPDAASHAMAARPVDRFEPDPQRSRRYEALLPIYADTYAQVRSLLHRLDVFRRDG